MRRVSLSPDGRSPIPKTSVGPLSREIDVSGRGGCAKSVRFQHGCAQGKMDEG